MDFRVITLNGQHVLLERIGEPGSWEVIISVYRGTEDRYDEWSKYPNPGMARQVIADFTDLAARQFLTRAEADLKAKGKSAAKPRGATA